MAADQAAQHDHAAAARQAVQALLEARSIGDLKSAEEHRRRLDCELRRHIEHLRRERLP